MLLFYSFLFFFFFWFFNETNSSSVGVIRNASLILFNVNSTIIYGTCQQCLCNLYLNGTYSSFNCNDDQMICQMYWRDQQSQTYSLTRNSSSKFYFLSFPVNFTLMTTESVQTSTATSTSTSTTSTTTSTTTTTRTTTTSTTSRTTSTSSTTSTTTTTTTTTRFNPYTDLRWNATGSIAAGTGTKGSTASLFDKSACIYIDANDSMYICDHENHRIQKWTQNATAGITIAGDPTVTNGSALPHPEYLTFDKYGSLYVTGHALYSVMRFLSGSYNGTQIAGDGSSGTALDQLGDPTGMIVDDNRTLFVVDGKNKRITRWPYNSPNGTVVISDPLIDGVVEMVFVPGFSTRLYLSNQKTHAIYIWDFGASAPFATLDTVNHTTSNLNHPWGLTLDKYGNLYVADRDNDRIVMFVANSTIGIPVVIKGTIAPLLEKPMDVAFDSQSNMYVVIDGNMVIKFTKT